MFKIFPRFTIRPSSQSYLALLGIAAVAGLLLYKLGSLTTGISATEKASAAATLGWHGIYHNPFYLPLEFWRSVFFSLFSYHGSGLIRLANTGFGALAVILFARLLFAWYGARTAVLASILFATSAWTLHVSRLASNDVLYLLAIPALFMVQQWLKRSSENSLNVYRSLAVWGLLLYVPGLVWLIGLQLWLQRKEALSGLKELSFRQKTLAAAGLAIWLSLLVLHLTRSLNNITTWLGLPHRWPGAFGLLKQMLSVPVHLFIHGPKQPELWLGRAAILDIVALVLCILGVYFYSKHWKAGRSRWLLSFLLLGSFLVGLGGPVSLSLVVPLLYVFAACGLGYLLHDWFKVFPANPLARNLGIALISLAVLASAGYNLRAYFVAWPNSKDAVSTFIYRP